MPNGEAFTDIELRNIQAESNGVTTTIEPVGWKWIDQPLVGAAHNGLNCTNGGVNCTNFTS